MHKALLFLFFILQPPTLFSAKKKLSLNKIELLFDACVIGELITIEEIFEKYDFDENTKKNGLPLLIVALIEEQYKIARYLIKHKIGINIPDQWGNYPLHIAVDNDDVKMVSLLLKHGAIINVYDYNKKTPLNYQKSEEVALLLLKYSQATNPPHLKTKKTLAFAFRLTRFLITQTQKNYLQKKFKFDIYNIQLYQ